MIVNRKLQCQKKRQSGFIKVNDNPLQLVVHKGYESVIKRATDSDERFEICGTIGGKVYCLTGNSSFTIMEENISYHVTSADLQGSKSRLSNNLHTIRDKLGLNTKTSVSVISISENPKVNTDRTVPTVNGETPTQSRCEDTGQMEDFFDALEDEVVPTANGETPSSLAVDPQLQQHNADHSQSVHGQSSSL